MERERQTLHCKLQQHGGNDAFCSAHIESYEFPDENIIIRFRCAEALFQPFSLATRFHDVFFFLS